jgi:hypothetical protein
MITSLLEDKYFCFTSAGIIYFLKGIGILWFIPTWPILLFIVLGISNFILDIWNDINN